MTEDQALITAAAKAVEKLGDSVPVYKAGENYNLDGRGKVIAHAQVWSLKDNVARVQLRFSGARTDWINLRVK